LRNLIERRRASEKGFTLIELLVVIVILGILAAVVVFAVGGLSDKGQTSSCKIDTRTLKTAEEAYFAKQNTYADQTTIKNFGLLDSVSTLHGVRAAGSADTVTEATGNLATYEVYVKDAKCGTVGKVTDNTANY
jgi:prepilin-type N-terminal cleavage/methylation domain-containing protein